MPMRMGAGTNEFYSGAGTWITTADERYKKKRRDYAGGAKPMPGTISRRARRTAVIMASRTSADGFPWIVIIPRLAHHFAKST